MAGLSLRANASGVASTTSPTMSVGSAFNPGGAAPAASSGGLSSMTQGFGAGFGVSVLAVILLAFIRHSLPR